MLFTAFYNDLPQRATIYDKYQPAGQAPTSKVPRNSPHSTDTELDAIDCTSSHIIVTVTECAAARDV